MNAREVNFRDINSVLKLLTGNCYVPGTDSPMDRPPELPVDALRIVRGYIYDHPENKDVFEKALYKMGNSSVDNVYLFYEFIDACLVCEMHKKIAPFHIDQQLLLPLLRKQIKQYDKELRGTVVFSNGFAKTNPMKTIEETARWYQKEFGFSLLG